MALDVSLPPLRRELSPGWPAQARPRYQAPAPAEVGSAPTGSGAPHTFTVVDTGEPHARRMAELLDQHPEIEELYGYDRRTALVVHLIVAVQMFLAWAVTTDTWAGTWWGTLLIAAFAGGPLAHWAGMGIHEASHNLAARTANGNRWVALVANIPLVIPAAMSFCRYHLYHHILLGVEGKDNDLPSRWEVRNIGTSPVRKAMWLLSYLVWGVTARGFINKPNRWERINIAWQAVAMTALFLALGPWALAYLMISNVLGYGVHPVAAHWIHEHYLFEGSEQETNSYYGPLNRLTFNVGYHNEHHDFMRVPGWRLPELHAIAEDTYGALATDSWVNVMWDFVWRRDIGHHARIVRSMDTFKRARPDRAAQRRAGSGHRLAHLALHR